LSQRKTDNVTKWQKAASEVVARAGISIRAIAERVRFDRSLVDRQIKGVRPTTPARAREINEAIGAILHSEDVAAYLDAVLALETFETADFDKELLNAAMLPAFESIHIVGEFLQDNYEDAVLSEMQKLPRTEHFTLILDLNKWRRRGLMRRIDGTVQKELSVDEITKIFAKYDIDLAPLKLPEHEIKPIIAQKRLTLMIYHALAETTALVEADPRPKLPEMIATRNRLERQIDAAFKEYRDAQWASTKHLLELRDKAAMASEKAAASREELAKAEARLAKAEGRLEVYNELLPAKSVS
jgi:hypothetical protein